MSTDLVPMMGENSLDLANMSYEQLLALDSLRVEGYAIVDKKDLLGVPHIITRVSYWAPKTNQSGPVSCESVIADEATLKSAVDRGWCGDIDSINKLRVKPQERIVYNDGSTGIRRQVTCMLMKIGLLNVGDADPADFETGRAYDKSWTEWTSFAEWRRQSEQVGNVPSFSRHVDGRPLLIRADRGLSVSNYTNEYTDEGETYYLR